MLVEAVPPPRLIDDSLLRSIVPTRRRGSIRKDRSIITSEVALICELGLGSCA